MSVSLVRNGVVLSCLVLASFGCVAAEPVEGDLEEGAEAATEGLVVACGTTSTHLDRSSGSGNGLETIRCRGGVTTLECYQGSGYRVFPSGVDACKAISTYGRTSAVNSSTDYAMRSCRSSDGFPLKTYNSCSNAACTFTGTRSGCTLGTPIVYDPLYSLTGITNPDGSFIARCVWSARTEAQRTETISCGAVPVPTATPAPVTPVR